MAFTSRHEDSPQHRNISSNTKQFNVQIERLMFCKAIRHYLCLRCTILHYAEPFHATLHHLCVRCGRHVFVVNVWAYAKIQLGCMVYVKLHISWKGNLPTVYTYDEDQVSYKG